MKTFNLLLANSEGLLNNFIQVLVQDVCEDHGTLNCTSTETVDELISYGVTGRFDLIILIPNNLAPGWMLPANYGPFGEACRAIRTLHSKCATPIIAIAAFENRAKQESLLLSAGAAVVLELPFHPPALMASVGRLLKLEDNPTLASAEHGSLVGALAHTLKRLTRALPARRPA